MQKKKSGQAGKFSTYIGTNKSKNKPPSQAAYFHPITKTKNNLQYSKPKTIYNHKRFESRCFLIANKTPYYLIKTNALLVSLLTLCNPLLTLYLLPLKL